MNDIRRIKRVGGQSFPLKYEVWALPGMRCALERVKRMELFFNPIIMWVSNPVLKDLSGEINYASSIPAGVMIVEMFMNSFMFCQKQIFD